MDMPADVLDDFDGLLDWGSLGPWIENADLPGEGPVTAVAHLTGGTQNNVFRLERAGATMVLRRPSRVLRPRSNDTIGREARILAALGDTDVPCPRLLAHCDDASVIGACFYVMSDVSGFTPDGELPVLYDEPASRRSMALQLVEGAAKLATVDHRSVGLEDLGRPDGWIERQVARWHGQLEEYLRFPEYPRSALPYVDGVGTWLDANRPHDQHIGVIHGDYQFANVMFAHDEVRLSAIIDWELASLGDPLLDLGWVLASWDEPGDPPGHHLRIRPWRDFPSRAELVTHYADHSGRDVSAMPWYFVLACYKLGIILEGTYARGLAAGRVDAVAERLHANAVWLLTKARRLCS